MGIPPIKVIITGTDHLSSVLGHAAKGLDGIEKKTAKFRASLLAITAPIAGIGLMSLRSAGNFEESMNRVRAYTGASTDEMKGLEDAALKSKKAMDFGDGMAILAEQGLDATNILKAMPGFTLLAKASHNKLSESIGTSFDIMKAYDLENSKIVSVTKVLSNAFASARIPVATLAGNLEMVAPIASATGIKFDEVAAALVVLGKAGVKGERAGTGLSKGLAALISPAAEAAATLDKLHIRPSMVKDSKGQIKSLATVIDVLNKAGATSFDIIDIFGIKAGPVMARLIGQGAGALQKYQTELNGSTEAAQKLKDAQDRGLNDGLEELENAFTNLSTNVAKSGLLDYATRGIEKLSGLLAKVAAFSQAHPGITKMAAAIAGIAALVGPLVIGFGMVCGALSNMLAFGAMLVPLFSKALMVLGGISAPVILAAAAAIIWAHNITMIMENWDELVGDLQFWCGKIGEWFSGLWDGAKKGLMSFVNAIAEKFDWIKTQFSSLMNLIPESIRTKIGLSAAPGNATPSRQSSNSTAPGLSAAVQSINRTNNAAVTVKFDNLPRGTTVKSESSSGVRPGLDIGYSMQ